MLFVSHYICEHFSGIFRSAYHMSRAIHSYQGESRRLLVSLNHFNIDLFERAYFRLSAIDHARPRLHRFRCKLCLAFPLKVRRPALRSRGVANQIQVPLVDQDVDLVG